MAARAFAAGCGFSEFGRRWDAPAFAAWLAENQVTHTSLVPTQVHDLVAAGVQAPVSLRAIVVGGGHLDAATGRAARALGWPVLASYGMTEAASQIATQGLDSLKTLYQPAPLPAAADLAGGNHPGATASHFGTGLVFRDARAGKRLLDLQTTPGANGTRPMTGCCWKTAI